MRIVNIEAIPLWASFAEAFGTVDAVPVELRHPAFGMRDPSGDGFSRERRSRSL